MNAQQELLEQAEASVLGASLWSEAYAAQAMSRLDEADFRRDAHRVLFRAIGACARGGQHGTVAVTSWLIDSGDLDTVGGPAAVSQLSSRQVGPAAFADRLDRVASARRRRLLVQVAERLRDAATDWTVPDDQLRTLAFAAVADAEEDVSSGGIVTASARREQVGDILKSGTSSRSVSTGWRTLDRHYRPSPGRWTLVGGVPGHGKSSVLDALVHNLADLHGWRTLIVSPEKQPIELHIAQLVQMRCGRPLLNRGVPAEGPDVDEAFGWVDEHFAWIDLSDSASDVASLLAMARLEHLRRPFHGVIVDPWNELDHRRESHLSETEHISQSLSRIRGFARRLDVHVWLVAHPTKLRKGEDGQYPVPTPYDVSGSANWRNKADCAIAVWRDVTDDSTPSQVHVQKVRFKPDDGREGMVEIRFDPTTGRFSEVASW